MTDLPETTLLRALAVTEAGMHRLRLRLHKVPIIIDVVGSFALSVPQRSEWDQDRVEGRPGAVACEYYSSGFAAGDLAVDFGFR